MKNSADIELTHTQKLLLEISKEYGITATSLALRLYPDSDGWGKTFENGNDKGMLAKMAQQGKGMWLLTGSQVGKLIKKGFVRRVVNRKGIYEGYEITLLGLQQIKDIGPSVKEKAAICPECGSTNLFDLETKYECDDCQHKFEKTK